VSSTAWVITIVYAAFTIVGVTVALIVFRSTRVGFRVRVAGRESLERREGYWGIAVVTLLVVVLGGTIWQVPYWSDNSDEPTPQRISIVGRQFAWSVDPPRIRAGVRTKVALRAADVNHGIGVYDPDDTLIKQVNVLPDVTQEFVITFEKRGTYTLRCLEFCGVDHHLMENTLEVTG
jgi:cytochrome c oxidase subunit II